MSEPKKLTPPMRNGKIDRRAANRLLREKQCS
jgi:hypothetical protein